MLRTKKTNVMRNIEELQLLSPSELQQIYLDLIMKSESSRLTREEKSLLIHLEEELDEHDIVSEAFYSM